MLSMNVHHPDVLKFIKMKNDKTKVTGANVSVQLTDEFLTAVDNDEEYEQRWPITGEAFATRRVKAREVWTAMVASSTATAEPGLMFIDAMRRELPADCYPNYKIKTTNPCGEVPLSVDSCRLTSINLTGYVVNAFKQDAEFDYDRFIADVKLAMQILDNVVDIELERVEGIMEQCDSEDEKKLWQTLFQSGKNGRRTGLGTHGLADCLAQLRIKYDSQKGLETIDKIYKTLRDSAYESSVDLAEIRGPFKEWDWEIEKDCDFLQRLPKDL